MSTELDSSERELGAIFGDFGGVSMPARFQDPAAEWQALRHGCGIVDGRLRRLWRLQGGDRVAFLQGMITNDVKALASGSGVYAALLTIQGRVVTDLRVYALDEELWLDVPANGAQPLRDSLERYIIADDVELAADSIEPLLLVEGPQAASVLLSAVGENVAELVPLAHRSARFNGAAIRIAAASHAGETGYVIYGEAHIAAQLWSQCRAAGGVPVGIEALDVARIEAGIPWLGRDMDDSLLIGEVGLEEAISYRKGCYLGQEVVERVAARGQVQRKRLGLLCEGEAAPAPGTKLLLADKEIGWVTSATRSPALQRIIAMGYARREAWPEGTQLTLGATGPGASVCALPFI